MGTVLNGIEYIVSKLGHPDPAIGLANLFIENQHVTGYRTARIGRNCTIRGNIHLGKEVCVLNGCELRIDVDIGNRTKIGTGCELLGDIELEKYCAIARNVTFQQLNHPVDRPTTNRRFYEEVLNSKLAHVSNGPINVGNDVWIGTNVIVLSGVTIGDGAVVGAGSVVAHDVEPYSVVAGTPAEHTKWRFPEGVRDRLQDVAWWDWEDDQIRRNREFFHTKIESVADINQALAE